MGTPDMTWGHPSQCTDIHYGDMSYGVGDVWDICHRDICPWGASDIIWGHPPWRHLAWGHLDPGHLVARGGRGAMVTALSHGPTGGGAVLGTETVPGKHRGHARPRPGHRGATPRSQPAGGHPAGTHGGTGTGSRQWGDAWAAVRSVPKELVSPEAVSPRGSSPSEVDGADVPVGALCSVPSQGAGGCTGRWRGPVGSLRPLAAGRKLWVRVGKSSSGHACATVPFRGGRPCPSPDESERHRGRRGSPRCVSPATAGPHASARPRALTPFCAPH